MKIIAFYLPQFHEIPENNKWWGNGFTEWTNTKKAKPLFKGHYQPREPFEDNYYNLIDRETREWQAKIAKEYGVYGFCYYHYWFKGKKLLEKPAEDMLEHRSPNFPFCFSWANESWTRAWDGKVKEALIVQDYGGKEDWEEHFNYLLPFFKDERYIRVDNKPLFAIYRSSLISKCDEMIMLWQELAKSNGLDGIYFVKTLNAFEVDNSNKEFNAQIEFEPMYTRKHDYSITDKLRRKFKEICRKRFGFNSKLFLDIDSYDYIWNKIISRKYCGEATFLGAFVDWDNSARKQRESTIISGTNPNKFEYYLKQQILRAKEIYGTDMIFINAWNEWAEGTYLEPDKKYRYKYLEAVKSALMEDLDSN